MKNKNLILSETQYLLAPILSLLPSIWSTMCHSPANCGTHDMAHISNLRWLMQHVSLWVKSIVIFQCPGRDGVREIVITIETEKLKQIIYYYNFYSILYFEWKISCYYPYYFWSKQKYLLSFTDVLSNFNFNFKFVCTKLANTSD